MNIIILETILGTRSEGMEAIQRVEHANLKLENNMRLICHIFCLFW
jgi:hypothetical protein